MVSNPSVLNRLLCAIFLATLLAPLPAGAAADPVNGHALYLNGTAALAVACASCHGPDPTANVNGVLATANNPSVLTNFINSGTGGMGIYAGKITAGEIADIVAYIGNPAATTVPTLTTTDVRTYVPASAATGGYVSYLRVINSGTTATAVSAARIDPASGAVGSAGQLTASLPPGGAVTFTAQQVEAAMGMAPVASERPRVRLSAGANTTIEAQSFLLQPGGVFNEVSPAQSGTIITVPTYIPAAGAASGYQSYLRVINRSSAATSVSVARIDPATGQTGPSASLIASLAAGAAQTYNASQIEATLGLSLPAGERPSMVVFGNGSALLDVQTFLTQPGGAFTNVSSWQSGTTVDVRSYIPAAAPGFTTYLRVVNGNGTPTPVAATLLDGTTGAAGASGTIIASLPGGGAMTLTSAQIEAALGVSVSPAARPRLRVVGTAGNNLVVQSFMLQPGGAFNEFSGALHGTSVIVRTYIPAADAVTGYTSYLRVINTGAVATPVSVALVDGTTGITGNPATLVASLAAGAAQSFTPAQVEAALGTPIAMGSRPRIQVSGNGGNILEVQSLLIQPGGVFTEVSGAGVVYVGAQMQPPDGGGGYGGYGGY